MVSSTTRGRSGLALMCSLGRFGLVTLFFAHSRLTMHTEAALSNSALQTWAERHTWVLTITTCFRTLVIQLSPTIQSCKPPATQINCSVSFLSPTWRNGTSFRIDDCTSSLTGFRLDRNVYTDNVEGNEVRSACFAKLNEIKLISSPLRMRQTVKVETQPISRASRR